MSVAKYILATRPWSFSASLLPAVLGNVISYSEHGVLTIPTFVYVITCVLCIHCGGNLVNSYYDYVNGIDSISSDDKTIVSTVISPRTIFCMFLTAYLIGVGVFWLLYSSSNGSRGVLTVLFVLGLSGSYFYTGGVGLKYYALGDIVIFATFGPCVAYFGYVAQGGAWSLKPLIYVMPIALHVEAILHGNNARDYKTDKKSGIVTLPILLGDPFCSYILYLFLLGFPYVVVLAFVMSESVLFILPLFTAKLAFDLAKQFQSRDLEKIPQESAQLNLLFGGLYISAFILKSSFSM